jgi:hypothetical protein
MEAEQLDAIEERANAATPGPWLPYSEERWCGVVTGERGEEVEVMVGQAVSEADAEFVAHAREDVPALVTEVRRLSGYLSPFQPGDPDPTPNDSERGACGVEHPDDGNPNRCTWELGHPERWSHVAGNGEIITAVF